MLNKYLRLFLFTLLIIGFLFQPERSLGQTSGRRIYLPFLQGNTDQFQFKVNMPYFSVPDIVESDRFREMAIFWYGYISAYESYTDVRIAYNDTAIFVYAAVFDRLFWFDETPSATDLTQWDSVTLYLNTDGPIGDRLSGNSYKFESQIALSWYDRNKYQYAYRGNGTSWTQASIPFSTSFDWRGNSFNSGGDNSGWALTFEIPYTSLGLSGMPSKGKQWGLAISTNDRDNSNGSIYTKQSWPPEVTFLNPSSWGTVRFGLAEYKAPPSSQSGSVVIRENSTIKTPDGDVGGHFGCGDGLDYWTEWGNEVYYLNPDGSFVADVNVQNQSDISDWPCFSKYFVTFPLSTIPNGKVILSASLTLHQFGSSGDINNPDPFYRPVTSPIQVFLVDRDFTESSLNWNTAPLALENVSMLWVDPISFSGWPGVPRTWDVTYAVAKAYAQNQPLRLGLYSADNAYHSGRYFVSADVGDWNAVARPTLRITYGNP